MPIFKETQYGDKAMLPQVRAALGNICLSKLQPHHIIEFLKNLAEVGIRRDNKYKALPAVDKSGKTQKQLSTLCGLSTALFNRAIAGKINVYSPSRQQKPCYLMLYYV